MNNFDVELQLLAQGLDIQPIGEHELKTSPLVSRDAANRSGQFSQRGVLGSVLSLHSQNLPTYTQDPRLYLNLAAPASGLVCGVQGSGKSHTVSCILESSLMNDPRVGSLPVPLATVVFHFDEENGGRPCESAYLSELGQGGGRGIKEVVVLTSPSNILTRRRIYSSLKYVHVEPLRIAEEDLNAARMLSMMGADNLEVVPLYLHTALSILREMGSDEFSYKAFRERLAASDFNKAQGAMLQLRLDLLHSFLQGTGKDISSFFQPGRLVIIDLSDPFVDATTAAMLFDICLGLFIEWRTAAGKLIVLDEAHKYLTNSDANRFTKSICSIIRQQRHLATRVVVSTQEPTVVPPSVLDLLSWIICHRFSSPSWVKHLKHHVCVQDEDHEEFDQSTDWGKRVMTLRTGEALLFSPASLFVSVTEDLSTLAAGYAIIKSRPRLTRDGGESILATKDPIPVPITLPSQSSTGIATPSRSNSSFTPSPPAQSSDYFVMPQPSIPASPAIRREQLLNRWAQSTQSPTLPQPYLFSPPPVPNRVPIASVFSPAPVNQPLAPTPTPPKITPAPTGGSNSMGPYQPLIMALRKLQLSGGTKFASTNVAEAIHKINSSAYSGKLKKYLKEAQTAGIVTLSGKDNTPFVSLHPSIASAQPSSFVGTTPATHTQASSAQQNAVSRAKFQPLIDVLGTVAASPGSMVDNTVIGAALKKKNFSYKNVGYSKLVAYVEAAEAEGLVRVQRKASALYVGLASH